MTTVPSPFAHYQNLADAAELYAALKELLPVFYEYHKPRRPCPCDGCHAAERARAIIQRLEGEIGMVGDDDELKSLKTAYDALRLFPDDTQRRMMEWLEKRLCDDRVERTSKRKAKP